jgi:hypothetical protein
MEKHFVTYNQSLALKELGFDIPCFRYVYIGDTGNNVNRYEEVEPSRAINYNHDSLCISQPLKSQVFEWFREKHNLLNELSFYRCDRRTKKSYWFTIFKWDDKMVSREIIRDKNDTYYSTYDDAESACIDKLIELVKNGR